MVANIGFHRLATNSGATILIATSLGSASTVKVEPPKPNPARSAHVYCG